MYKLIDAHIHLTNEQYQEDLADIIKQCQKEGVQKLIVIGCDFEEIKASISLAKQYKDYIYLALGYHPVQKEEITTLMLDNLEKELEHNPNVVALGEIGLDYYHEPNNKENQKELFRKQIQIAKKHNKPIVIHARESYDDCYEILREEDYFHGIMHSFADDYQSAQRFLEKGMYLSISGPVTFKNGYNQKEVIKNMPLDRLLIETDGPYLTPVPYRGKRNHPVYLKYILEEIAELRSESIDNIQTQIIKNTETILKGIND